jgi:hypothetical protein
MTINDELLEALKAMTEWDDRDAAWEKARAAIVKAEQAERVEPAKPVAKVVQKVIKGRKGAPDIYKYEFVLIDPALGPCNLYTTPPAAAVNKPLTDEQIKKLLPTNGSWFDFARAIEAAIRSK